MRPMYAEAHRITNEEAPIDGYARGGVAMSRDAAHITIAALRRDAAAMRERGGEANEKGAQENDALALSIGKALTGRYPSGS